MRTVGESIATTRGQCVVELTIVTRRGLAAQGFFPHHALRLRRIWSSVLWSRAYHSFRYVYGKSEYFILRYNNVNVFGCNTKMFSH